MGSLRRERFQTVQLDRRLWRYPYSPLSVILMIITCKRTQHPGVLQRRDLQPSLFPLPPSTKFLAKATNSFVCYGALSAPKHKLTSLKFRLEMQLACRKESNADAVFSWGGFIHVRPGLCGFIACDSGASLLSQTHYCR